MVGWSAIVCDGDMTYEDFLIVFYKKYFPREALHQKKNAFEHLRQGTRSVREYEREFCQLRLFASNNFDAEDLIRRFLDGMRVAAEGALWLLTPAWRIWWRRLLCKRHVFLRSINTPKQLNLSRERVHSHKREHGNS